MVLVGFLVAIPFPRHNNEISIAKYMKKQRFEINVYCSSYSFLHRISISWKWTKIWHI